MRHSGGGIIAAALLTLAVGGALRLAGLTDEAHFALQSGLVLSGLPIVWNTARHAVRGHFATDIVATLAIVGAVAIGQPFAGLIVVLMQTGGEALEAYAAGRASAALAQLEADAPRLARRRDASGAVTDVRVDEISVGDTIVIRPGDVVPCDSAVLEGVSHLDTSRITGEPVPRRVGVGSTLKSGMLNLEGALVARAVALAAESQYAKIVALVRSAQLSKSPLQRLADRYAVWFTPITIGVCVVTWLVTHDATRVLAILTIATPCPLILATPVAIVGGISRAAQRQVIVRDGAALEALAEIDTLALDKTGTITSGNPQVVSVHATEGFNHDQVLRLAGALEQVSSHVVGRAILDAARTAGLSLQSPSDVNEEAGNGITGVVAGHEVVVGGREYVRLRARGDSSPEFWAPCEGRLTAWVLIDGRCAGRVGLDDLPRASVNDLLSELKSLGISRVVMLSGDDDAHTQGVASSIGLSEASGNVPPEAKARYVREMQDAGHRVLMLGDGTNDAPVLAAADVGIAVAASGGGIAAETADAVLLTDDLTAVADALRIGRRSLAIARQSIRVGLGLSAIGMVLAAGRIVGPAAGALIQEGIDLAVIINALRAATTPRNQKRRDMPTSTASVRRSPVGRELTEANS